jgi:anthranilate phosphoribosyltransferase
MIKEILEKVTAGENLTIDESFNTMIKVMEGEISPILLSGFLMALKSKGETPGEIAGFAKAMREKSVKINSDREVTIDVCGTGGDNSGTFNISTATAFVVAGTGIKVAKHGNKSISSSSGSADVLRELGVNVEMDYEKSQQALDEIGITFLFAPKYHPAMKHAAQTRKELSTRTVFNILGPLTNPAGVSKQFIGTFSNKTSKLLSEAAEFLDYEKVSFVCNDDKYDEILLDDDTEVFIYDSKNSCGKETISNSDFNYPVVNKDEIKGGSPMDNAKIIFSLFKKPEPGGIFKTVCANTAYAIYSTGFSNSLRESVDMAEGSINSGKAFEKLKRLADISNK